MYSVYGNKKDILLWCHLVSNQAQNEKSCKRPDKDSVPNAKRDSYAQKIIEVEKIVDDLKENYGAQYIHH